MMNLKLVMMYKLDCKLEVKFVLEMVSESENISEVDWM